MISAFRVRPTASRTVCNRSSMVQTLNFRVAQSRVKN